LSRVIGVFSGKGGVGKTTLVANLGTALTNVFNKNVLIFDSNIHTSHLGLHFGLYKDLPVTLREVLKKDMPIMQALYIHPPTGIRVIPAPLGGEGVDFTREKCGNLINQVKDDYDMVILDCAPGLGKEAMTPMSSIDEAILICTPDIVSLTDALKTAEVLKKLKKDILGIVVNRHRNQKYELTSKEINSAVKTEVLATIPEDSKIPESISKGTPVTVLHPNSKSSKAFKKLAAHLSNEVYWDKNILDAFINFFRWGKDKKSNKRELYADSHQVENSGLRPKGSIENKLELIKDVKKMLRESLKKDIKDSLRRKLHGE